MLELLTGTGLALAAGLNAWIPLVVIGALDRFTGLIELPPQWAWLSNGGLAFGSGVSATTTAVTDPETFFSSQQWVPIAIGVGLALLVHLAKAMTRPVVNAATAGVGAPVASAAEDAGAFALAFAAILAPVLVVLGIVAIAALVIIAVRRRRARSARHPSIAP